MTHTYVSCFSDDVSVRILMQARQASQSWYRTARFENEIQNENYQKVNSTASIAGVLQIYLLVSSTRLGPST